MLYKIQQKYKLENKKLKDEVIRLNASIQPLREQSNRYATVLSKFSLTEEQMNDLTLITAELKELKEKVKVKDNTIKHLSDQFAEGEEKYRNLQQDVIEKQITIDKLRELGIDQRQLIRRLQEGEKLKECKVPAKKHFYFRLGFE